MYTYELGNALRGYKNGDYPDDETAWNELSDKFNRSFPSRSGRAVFMRKYIRNGKTAGGNETAVDREIREAAERILAGDKT